MTAADFLSASQSLSTVISMFLIDRSSRRCSPNTIKFYQNNLRGFEKYCASQAATEVQQVDAGLLRNYLLLLAEHYNPGGVHAAFRSIRALFRWVERQELLSTDWRNPLCKLDAPRLSQKILEPIPLEVVDRLQASCKGTGFFDRRDRAVLFTLLDTGIRASELCHLDLGDVNVSNGEVKVREGTGGKDRIVYLGPTGLRAVQCYLRKRPNTLSEALFVSKSGDRLSHEGVRQLLERRCSKARLAQTYFPARFSARVRRHHAPRRG